MDSHRDTDITDDLSALAWVQDELRRSLDAAHKALRRYLKESEAQRGSDVDVVDPAVLRSARQQLHQGVGALELVGLPAAAVVLRASEAAIQRMAARPQKLTVAAIESIEQASFALLDYLSRLLAGRAVSPVAMFPQYRAVQELAGADRVHPADLWSQDWSWHELPADPTAVPRAADPSTRAEIEGLLLQSMRGAHPVRAAADLSDVFAGLGAAEADAQTATLWRLAAAFFEAQSQGLLRPDNYTKRVGSRLLAQLRMIESGDSVASERLAQDLLFFCGQCDSPGDGRGAPRLAAARQVHGLAARPPVDYAVSRLGRFDPALIVQARKRVAAAKDAWSSVAGGEMHRLAGLAEQFALVADSLNRLYASGSILADEMAAAVNRTVQHGDAPPPALAMEVATSVLYLEASLDDGALDDPSMAQRIERLAARIAAVRSGAAPEPLEAWMEELYRRVSDRQTMGSVVQELRLSLSEAEKHIDQYFRDPSDRNVLIPVPGQLSAMRGVLSVLGMDQASAAVLRMRDDIDRLVSDGSDTGAGSVPFERLAGNLGALGFLIDMLSVQPQMAKSLFVFDAEAGTFSPVMGRHGATEHDDAGAPAAPQPRLIEQAQSLAVSAIRDDVPVDDVSRDLERLSHEALVADQPALAATVAAAQAALERAEDAFDESAAREQLALAMNDFVVTASDATTLGPPAAQAAPPALVTVPSAVEGSGLEEDVEMREVFLEEAREVLGGAHEALSELVEGADDIVGPMTTVRRAFHTLKGSSRMVGLAEFGEAAWACEQLYNARLAEAAQADDALLGFTSQALAYMDDWTAHIAGGRDAGHDPAAVRAAADALRLGGAPQSLPLPAVSALVEEPLALLSNLPSAAELDLPPSFDLLPEGVAAATPVAHAAEIDFELNLRALDEAVWTDSSATIDGAQQVPLEDIESGVEPPETALQDHEATVPLPLLDDIAPAEVADETIERIDIDLDSDVVEPEVVEAAAAPEATAIAEPEGPADYGAPPADEVDRDLDQFKVVGPLRISIPLFNIYLNEADELSRRLTTEVAEWSMELNRPVGEHAVALAHSLAGSSATVGYADLSHLARIFESALTRSHNIGTGTAGEARLFADASDEIRRLLHQFAAGFLKAPSTELLQRLADYEIASLDRLRSTSVAEVDGAGDAERGTAQAAPVVAPQAAQPEPASWQAPLATALGGLGQAELKQFTELTTDAPQHITPRAEAFDIDDDIDAVDAVDAELFPIFEEEAQELLPQLGSRLRDWARRPGDASLASACMRTLHTLKGGARLAGAMRLGEMAHRLETAIEHLLARSEIVVGDVEQLHARADALNAALESLRTRDAQAYENALAAVVEPADETPTELAPVAAPELALPERVVSALPVVEASAEPEPTIDVPSAAIVPQTAITEPEIDWSRFVAAPLRADIVPTAGRAIAPTGQSAVRVRTSLLERLVNQSGEVSITRSRIESEVGRIKSSLSDLTDNLDRLRGQLRDIEFQAETQMASRMEAAKAASETFDPLEFDRFTRFQELTRMMAESVNDVATVQRTLQRTLEATEDELVAQARLTRELQDDLLRTRMVEFEGLSERLYRVVRQAAKETGKQVRLDILGGSIEVDRGVLDRMTGAFEHLLRNCVTHGIELPEARSATGKDPTGTIIVALTHEGNEVGVEFRDDGQGLDLARIRERGVDMGLLDAEAHHGEAELANLIFTPGFSTAETVTELAGRGIGMDVVRAEVNAMGGRIETATAAGQGTSFKLVLPLTTAVTQVVMLRCAETTIAVPSTLVEIVRRATPAEIARAYETGSFAVGDRALPFFWFGALLQSSSRSLEAGRTMPVVVVRSAQQRVVIHVDEVLGNQEVVVKNLGRQLSQLPGLAGMTLLAAGVPALIYNPVALAALYGDAARAAARAALAAPAPESVQPAAEARTSAAPLILVVDDSLTVRRVTQRLLVREGYRVQVAKDGLEALEKLAEERPSVVLSDIEMPRMDGFDLVRNLRGDARWRNLPVIMITSRIAQKHRDHAAELGVDHYLGKPYSEDDLLALIARYVHAEVAA